MGDSNPRYSNPVRQFSKLVVSATHPTLRSPSFRVFNLKKVRKYRIFLANCKEMRPKFIFSSELPRFRGPVLLSLCGVLTFCRPVLRPVTGCRQFTEYLSLTGIGASAFHVQSFPWIFRRPFVGGWRKRERVLRASFLSFERLWTYICSASLWICDLILYLCVIFRSRWQRKIRTYWKI